MPTGSKRQAGFGYVGLMVAVVIFGLGSVGAARILASTDRGEREAELLFVGGQFRTAIRSYYESGPVAGKFPEQLDDLFLDRRVATPRRHLRKIFIDPVTGKPEWGLILAPQGGVMGVYSLSEKVPMKRDNFDVEDAGLLEAMLPAQQASAASMPIAAAKPLESTVKLTPVNSQTYKYQDWKFFYRPAEMIQKANRQVESAAYSPR